MVKIKKVSKILTDNHGFTYVNLTLDDGTEGFYPNTVEVLQSLSKGLDVRYSSVKPFNGMNKIVGLVILNNETQSKKMRVLSKIKSIGEIKSGANDMFYTKIEMVDGDEAVHFSNNYKDLSGLSVGDPVMYDEIKSVEGKGNFYVGLTKLIKLSADERRQLSIIRQSSLKVAVEIVAMSQSDADSRKLGADKLVEEIIRVSDLLVKYASVE